MTQSRGLSQGFRYARGMSVVELMIAVTIGFLLLAAVLQIFLGSVQTYRFQEAASRIQESGRFSLDFLRLDLRMAGFTGCGSASGGFSITDNLDPLVQSSAVNNAVVGFDASNALQGFTYTGGTPSAGLLGLGFVSGDLVAGTDVVVIKRAGACPDAQVLCHGNAANSSSNGQSCNSGSLKIASNSVCQIAKNDIVMVANCASADIFSVTNMPSTAASTVARIGHGASRNQSPKLSTAYGADAAIYRMSVSIYFIGPGASGEPALFRKRLVGSAFVTEELVEGIYNMEIQYGVDTDGDQVANYYARTADLNAADWARSVSSRIGISVRSEEDNLAKTAQTYSYNGSTVSDKRLRREFNMTVTLRNRI